jgi:AcrR family transcriptional regulator
MASETRKQIEIRNRELEILAKALTLLSGDSPETVTMDDIAAAVGISKGTLYNHFRSRDDIYGALVAQFSARVLQELARLPTSGDTRTRLRNMLAVFWDGYRANRAYLCIASHCEREGFRESLSPSLRATLEKMDADVIAIASGLLAGGLASGELRRAAIEELLLGPHLILIGLTRYLRIHPAGPAKSDPRFRALVRFVLSGLEQHDGP